MKSGNESRRKESGELKEEKCQPWKRIQMKTYRRRTDKNKVAEVARTDGGESGGGRKKKRTRTRMWMSADKRREKT